MKMQRAKLAANLIRIKQLALMPGLVGLVSFFLAGCGALNYNEVAPHFDTFDPKIALVLPVKMPEGVDLEAETAGNVITDVVSKMKRFDSVIDPATARSQMTADQELQEAVVHYLAKLRTLGVSDKDLSKKIGEIYHSDTLIAVDVGRWGYMRYGGSNLAEVTISIKMIDASTGTVMWKAGHASQRTYSFIKPNLQSMARHLAEDIFECMPEPKAKQA
jgi:hypothetical protein